MGFKKINDKTNK